MDKAVYDEVFLDRCYDLELGAPRYIIDAGAHVGMTSVFFALKYPDAQIIALEPEPANFAMLRANAAMYPQIVPINAGLWSKETFLKITNPDANSWSFIVEEAAEGIKAVSIASLLSQFDWPRIDVLKIDIEGSEVEVLNHSDAWMDKVGSLVVETHERFMPGSLAAVDRATAGKEWKRTESGLNSVFTPA